MKKSFAFVGLLLAATSLFAGSDLSFDLATAPDFASQVIPQVSFMPEPSYAANVAAPIVVPEPATAALMVASLAACGWRVTRRRRSA